MPLIATSRALVTTLEGLEFQMTTGEYYVWVFVSMDTLQNMADPPLAAGPLEMFQSHRQRFHEIANLKADGGEFEPDGSIQITTNDLYR